MSKTHNYRKREIARARAGEPERQQTERERERARDGERVRERERDSKRKRAAKREPYTPAAADIPQSVRQACSASMLACSACDDVTIVSAATSKAVADGYFKKQCCSVTANIRMRTSSTTLAAAVPG